MSPALRDRVEWEWLLDLCGTFPFFVDAIAVLCITGSGISSRGSGKSMSKKSFAIILAVACGYGATLLSVEAQVAPTKSRKPESNAEVAVRVREYFDRLSGFGFSGAALVARNGEVILKNGYGYAIREQ